MSITIRSGSILDSKADCIVNPANSFLRHGGGLARVIDQAANPTPIKYEDWESRWGTLGVAKVRRKQYRDDHEAAPLIATGNAHWTNAGLLPYKGIIHAVGPVYGGGEFYEADLLELAVSNAIRVATDHDCTSIALPAISCGIFGFPVEEAAEIHVEVASWADLIVDIEFWPFGFEAEFQKALDRVPSDL